MGISIEIVMILLLILLNGVLAMAEMAIVAARKGRLLERSRQGDRKAAAALALSREPNDLLSTVQIGITLVGVLAGAFGGATIAAALEKLLIQIALPDPYAKGISVGVVVILITFLTLIIGELVPKRLALNRPEDLAAQLAPLMKSLSGLAAPVVRVLSWTTDLVLKVLGVDAPDDTPVSEEEIRIMITQATQAGVFQPKEQDLMSGIFRLGDRRVGALITPRTEIDWLDLDDPKEINLRKVAESDHSRFPVARGSLDEVVGLVVAKDLLNCYLTGKPVDLESCLNAPVFVPESTSAMDVLELFKTTEPHIVLVIDEYGGVQGLLTIRDILEAIVGDFLQGGQADEAQIFRRADRSWLVDGMLAADEFIDAFHVSEMPDYDRGHFETLGGFVMSQLGKIPKTGDIFEWGGFTFEIVDMDGLRVDKILVKKSGVAPNSTENQ